MNDLGTGDIIGRIIIGILLGVFALFAIVGLFLNRSKKNEVDESSVYIMGDESEESDEKE